VCVCAVVMHCSKFSIDLFNSVEMETADYLCPHYSSEELTSSLHLSLGLENLEEICPPQTPQLEHKDLYIESVYPVFLHLIRE